MGRPGSICMVYRLWEQRASNHRTCRIWDRLRVYPSNPASDPLPDKVHSIHTPRLSLYLRRSASCLSKRSRCNSEGSTQGRVNESFCELVCVCWGENRVIQAIQHSQIIFISSLWNKFFSKSSLKMESLYSSLPLPSLHFSTSDFHTSSIKSSLSLVIWSQLNTLSSKRSLRKYPLHLSLRLKTRIVGMTLTIRSSKRFMLMWRRLNLVNNHSMTHSQIITKWLGKKYAESKELGNQCVAWAKKYAEESGHPIKGFSGSALNGWNSWSPFNNEWKRIENTANAIPKAGAVVFFDKTSTNPYGHVAIVDDGSTNTQLVVIEQNAGSGNGNGVGANAITRRTIAYTAGGGRGKCLGWYSFVGTGEKLPPVENLMEDVSTLSPDEKIYRAEVKRTGISGVLSDHSGDDVLTRAQVKALIDIAVVRVLESVKD